MSQKWKKCTAENFRNTDPKSKNNCTLFSSFFQNFAPFPRYGHLKSKFLCELYSHCIFSSCSIDLTKTRYTWSLTAVLLLFAIMFSFSNRCRHQPLDQASQSRVGRLLWNPSKEGYGGDLGQGGGEGVLRDGELWSALLRCEVKQGSSSFSEQGELLWDLFFIFLYFCCLDPAWCPRASGALDQHWP